MSTGGGNGRGEVGGEKAGGWGVGVGRDVGEANTTLRVTAGLGVRVLSVEFLQNNKLKRKVCGAGNHLPLDKKQSILVTV